MRFTRLKPEQLAFQEYKEWGDVCQSTLPYTGVYLRRIFRVKKQINSLLLQKPKIHKDTPKINGNPGIQILKSFKVGLPSCPYTQSCLQIMHYYELHVGLQEIIISIIYALQYNIFNHTCNVIHPLIIMRLCLQKECQGFWRIAHLIGNDL